MTATTTDTVTVCRNCGVRFDAPETPCPYPSGTPYHTAGRGGHFFSVELPAAEFAPLPVAIVTRTDFADGSAVVADPDGAGWHARTPRGWLCREEGGLVLRRLFTRTDAVEVLKCMGYARGATATEAAPPPPVPSDFAVGESVRWRIGPNLTSVAARVVGVTPTRVVIEAEYRTGGGTHRKAVQPKNLVRGATR